MKVEKELIRKILRKLYDDYFPYVVRVSELKDELQIDSQRVAAVLHYLEYKSLVESEEQRKWKITASGIDFLEGDLLKPEPVKSDGFVIDKKK